MRPPLRLVCVLALALAPLAAPGLASAAIPWCGNDTLSTDRPDTLGGRKWHVLYAIPSDGVDRFAETAPKITTDLAAVVTWWLREDPTRAPRFDLSAFPGCTTAIGNLDLSWVRLPQPTTAYFANDVRLPTLARDLAATFDDPGKKYLVYYDGVVADENVCGSAYGRDDPNVGGRLAVAGLFVQSRPRFPGCGPLGVESYPASTAAHEMLHMIGAVPAGAPHACAGNVGHICDRPNDVMASGRNTALLRDQVLDFGRDDYYGHSGGWWDAQDSPWLVQTAVADRPVRVEIAGGSGGEEVSSSPPGLSCPAVCSLLWAGGDRLILEPTAGTRTRFLRWEGDCSGDVECTLTVDGDKRVRAVFGPAYVVLRIAVSGRGTVRSAETGSCRGSCRQEVSADSRVELRAAPARGWRFAGWTGACTAAKLRPRCTVAMTASRTVGARFRRR